jgi:hypothetical protein
VSGQAHQPEAFVQGLTKAEASERIDKLKRDAGGGREAMRS